MRDFKEYTILNAKTPVAVTSSTDATPIVVTATAHGLATGDLVMIYGHATNVAANGVFKVLKVDANSFQLKDKDTGASVAGSGAGAGSGGVMIFAPKIPLVEDFTTSVISVFTSGTATLTLKIAGSIGKTDGSCPNFGATVSPTNPYTFIDVVDLDTNDVVEGSTGIAAVGADLTKQYELNCNGMKYLTIIPTAWTQGAITIKVQLFTN